MMIYRSLSSWFRILAYQAVFVAATGALAVPSSSPTYLLPMNCSELIPDPEPFLGFFEAIAQSQAVADKSLSRRILNTIALRNKLAEGWAKDANPIDGLIRKTLCFYRQQTDPLGVIPYSDPRIIAYVRKSMPQLEEKTKEVIFLVELEKAQRDAFESQIDKNRHVVQSIEAQAQKDANKIFSDISKSAKKKVRTQ